MLETGCGALGAARILEQRPIAVDDVGIARDGIDFELEAASGAQACHAITERVDRRYRVAEPHHAAQPLEMANHALSVP